MNKLLIFDISSKLAHFKKINTNSSALTYMFPPRTTILGLISGIMGLDRDSYYQDFENKQVDIGVEMVSKNRVFLQTVNYLMIKGKSDITGSKNHSQNPIEFMVSDNNVCYRIYFTCKNEELYTKLKNVLEQENYYYQPSLGPAYCLADIDFIGEFEYSYYSGDDYISINSPIKKGDIDKIKIKANLLRELAPRSFDSNRICTTDSYIYSSKSETIDVIPKGNKVISIKQNNIIKYISLL